MKLIDANDDTVSIIDLPAPGCNGVAVADLESTSSIVNMEVFINGSAAIDNITFVKERQDPGCTHTLGYWKTHAELGSAKKFDKTWNLIDPDGENSIFFLSGASYFEVISASTKGNAYYILAQQYIAAILNKLSGADVPANVKSALNDAKTLFETHTPDDIKSLKGNDETRKEFIDLSEILDDYNNGIIGPGHCDDLEDETEKDEI